MFTKTHRATQKARCDFDVGAGFPAAFCTDVPGFLQRLPIVSLLPLASFYALPTGWQHARDAGVARTAPARLLPIPELNMAP